MNFKNNLLGGHGAVLMYLHSPSLEALLSNLECLCGVHNRHLGGTQSCVLKTELIIVILNTEFLKILVACSTCRLYWIFLVIFAW
jgi:hypothetical protein